MINLFAKDGTAKLVSHCTYSLMGLNCVSRVYPECATFDIGADGVTMRETFGIGAEAPADKLDVALV